MGGVGPAVGRGWGMRPRWPSVARVARVECGIHSVSRVSALWHGSRVFLQGAFAKVYKARCIPKNCLVAVKILELEKLGSGIDEVRVRRCARTEPALCRVVPRV